MINHNKITNSKTYYKKTKENKQTKNPQNLSKNLHHSSGEEKGDQMEALVNMYNNCSNFSSFFTGKNQSYLNQASLTNPRTILPHSTTYFPSSLLTSFKRCVHSHRLNLLQEMIQHSPQESKNTLFLTVTTTGSFFHSRLQHSGAKITSQRGHRRSNPLETQTQTEPQRTCQNHPL